jgi:hypothetical protein
MSSSRPGAADVAGALGTTGDERSDERPLGLLDEGAEPPGAGVGATAVEQPLSAAATIAVMTTGRASQARLNP